jgi:hypothetical protein
MENRRAVFVAMLVLMTSILGAQERPTVSLQQLLAALDEAASITDAAVELRSQLADDLTPGEFVAGAAPLQRQFEPIIVLIAQTEPPREFQQFAMAVAMGVKGVELALWHYLYAAISGQAERIEYGDELLVRGRAELQLAYSLSADLR